MIRGISETREGQVGRGAPYSEQCFYSTKRSGVGEEMDRDRGEREIQRGTLEFSVRYYFGRIKLKPG